VVIWFALEMVQMNMFCIYQRKNDDKVITLINLSKSPQSFTFKSEKGNYSNVFTNDKVVLKGNNTFDLQPWQYVVLAN